MKSNLVEHITMRTNLENMNELAQTTDLIYCRKPYSVNLILTYKYIVINVGKSKKMKKNMRRITKVE